MPASTHSSMFGDLEQTRPDTDDTVDEWTPTRPDIVCSYRVAEFITLAGDGSPVCWPMAPDVERGRLIFSTGYMYPTKARNARRNPRVAALFSDPTASGRIGDDPLVLVQGTAEVFDQDLQRNTERYVDQLLRKGPPAFRMLLRIPAVRQALVGYLARIWIEVRPQHEYVWARLDAPPGPLRAASRPAASSPRAGIELPPAVLTWLPRYPRPPILSYVDAAGWPAAIRTEATVRRDHIEVRTDISGPEGAPACLTYHRLVGDYRANDTFLIRGHFSTAGRLIPEKVVGFTGTGDDRGVGSMKALRLMLGFGRQLRAQMETEHRPVPIARPTPRA